MKIYLAGRITGDPDYKARFRRAARKLETMFGPVLNPADLPDGLDNADYMAICTTMINCADMVAFLPGWTASPGAALEHNYCAYIGKEVLYLKEG